MLMGLGPDDPHIKQEVTDSTDTFNNLVEEFGSSLSPQQFGNFGLAGSSSLQPPGQGQQNQQHLYNSNNSNNSMSSQRTGLMRPNDLVSPMSSNSLADQDDLEPLMDDYSSLNTSPYSTTPAGATASNLHPDIKPKRSSAKKSSRSTTNQVGQYMYSYSLPTTSSGVSSSARNGTSHANSLLGGHPSSFGAFGSTTGSRTSGQAAAPAPDFASIAGTSYGDDDSDASAAAATGKPPGRLDANEKRRRRRESHNAVERRRRDNINEKIQELATLLPEYAGLSTDAGAPKPNKGVILRRSVEFLRHIVGVTHRLADRNRELESVLKRICMEADISESSLGLSLPLGTDLYDPGLPNPNTTGMNMDE